mmetsp:Transcript_14721/g.48279  ORF Transcript_14721/g.48279 Transcript_14721/m.48279 type:complete len:206 (+) Transcript_14721:1499-2116(+)
MIRSRVTFAITDAAAMTVERESPFTSGSAPFSARPGGTFGPSTIECEGSRGSAATARSIPRIVACRIFTSSISSLETTAVAHSMRGSARISSYRRSRSASESCLLSLSPAGAGTPSGMTHAAATTGPDRGPLPASSTPATSFLPLLQSRSSNTREGPAFATFAALGFAALGRVTETSSGVRCRFRFSAGSSAAAPTTDALALADE